MGTKISEFQQKQDHVLVTLDSGEKLTCSLLVGADGINS